MIGLTNALLSGERTPMKKYCYIKYAKSKLVRMNNVVQFLSVVCTRVSSVDLLI